MFTTIVVPVDLAHEDKLGKALTVSADLAKQYGAKIIYLGVTSAMPGKLGHNPAEYAEKLQAFAAAQAAKFGITADAKAEVSHDPTIDLDKTLMKAADAVGADLIVMASHVPGLADYIWPSNGGTVASHSKASVMVVRG